MDGGIEEGRVFDLNKGTPFLYEGSKIHRFKPFTSRVATKVNFRDDTTIQRKCHSDEDCARTKDDLELGTTDDYLVDESQLTVMTLPVEFMRRPSMTQMRMKRDPLFQGTRTRRKPRIIFKDGFRNITFKKIPEQSLLFFKDFVTSLVSYRVAIQFSSLYSPLLSRLRVNGRTPSWCLR